MVFHEITPAAIQHAVETPRELDRALVDAQETRRVLDRLYGYEVSPVLWETDMPKLSAGRAQSGCGGPVRTPDVPSYVLLGRHGR